MKKAAQLSLYALFLSLLGFQSAWAEEHFYSGTDGSLQNRSQLMNMLQPGSVVILGENHNNPAHQAQQLQVIRDLQALGHQVSVGMEFVPYVFQPACELWQQGKMDDSQFLSAIQWGGNPFELYRPQMAAPRWNIGERLIALNAPRELTRKIARTGFDSLSEDERKLMPPNFSVGNDLYFERFVKAIGHLPNPDAARNYFTAQSTWDDTMAWKAKQFLTQNPNQILVVIVGEFHVRYGGGLPDRMRARGLDKLVSITQLDASSLDDEQLKNEIQPDPRYGMRSDYIWTSRSGL